MKPTLVLVLSGLLVLALSAQALGQEVTEVKFVSSETTPVFRVSSLIVETSGLSLTSDVTEVLKRMELLTIAPATIAMPRGDYLLNWGGTEDFSRTFTLRVGPEPIEVRLKGHRTLAFFSLGSAALGTLGVLFSAPFLNQPGKGMMAVCVGSGLWAVGGLVGLGLFWPQVEVR